MEREREQVVSRLQDAFADEQIEVEELERRLELVARADTSAALAEVTADLAPGAPLARGDDDRTVRVYAIMGGADRGGDLVMPTQMHVLAFWGGAEIDLRRARFSARHELVCNAIMGGITVLVPDRVRVTCSGLGVMGGFSDRSRGSADPDAPELVITGVAFWGGVDLQTKASPAPRPRRGR